MSQTPIFMAARRTETSRTEYSGPAGQVSYVRTQTRGPAVEANSQYFADAYAYCRYTWSTRCQPNGACSTDDGMEDILLGYTEQVNYYGPANELIRTVTDSYSTTLSAAQPFDWRSGVVNGAPQGFTPLATDTLYRVNRVISEYYTDSNSNVQLTTTYTSSTSRGTGIKQGNIDALAGIRTQQKRTSTTISTTPIAPDNTATPQTKVVSLSSVIPLVKNGYVTPPAVSGPLVLDAQAPVPLLLDSQEEVDSAVATYEFFLKSSVLGEAYGLQIAEALTSSIAANWYPGMPFRYFDNRPGTSNDTLLAMRMDACVWGVDRSGAEVVTNGIWVGASDGDVELPSNLVGNNQPISPAAIVNETVVSKGSYAFVVNIDLTESWTLTPVVEDIVYLPSPMNTEIDVDSTLTIWVDGTLFGPGSLAELGPAGGPPYSNNGELILNNAEVFVDDLFGSTL